MEPDDAAEPENYVHMKRPFYARFDLNAFKNRVDAFWAKDLADANTDVLKEVGHVISVGEDSVFPFGWKEWLPHTPFFRVRRVTLEQLQDGLKQKDLWEPPREATTAGRLNLPNETFLYTALGDPSALMHETGLMPRDYFILIRYVLTEPIIFKQVALTNTDHDLTQHEQDIEIAISGFVRDVLSIPTDRNESRIYTTTQQVLRHYYPLAPEESGWSYESTQMPGLINAAILPRAAHTKLSVSTVVAGYVDNIDQDNIVWANYRAYSDGQGNHENKIAFRSFPRKRFLLPGNRLRSLEEYLAWTER